MGEPQRLGEDVAAVLRKLEPLLVSEEELARSEATRDRDRRTRLLEDSGISEVLTRRGFAAVTRGADALRPTRALQLVQSWLASEFPVFVLMGGTGIGKTVAAAHALSEFPGAYVEADTLARYRREHFGGPSARYRRLLKKKLLVIDELGTEESEQELARATLRDVVNRRQRRPLRTLLMGNLDRKQFEGRYDERTRGRLEEVGVVRRVAGPNLRREKAS